jgi:hypothetical protein
MTRACSCRHCTNPAAKVDEQHVPEPIKLPTVPRPIRVHTSDAPPFDCTLHPDGTLTAVMGGEVRRNFLSFAEMRERNWATAHIEWDPAPLADEPAAPAEPAVVQDALPAV